FFSIDLACCVAAGRDFHGAKVRAAAPVIYIAGEGQNGLKRRLSAWERHHRIPLAEAPLFLSRAAMALTEPVSVAAVLEAVEAVGTPPGLVVLDTLARNFGSGDEN